MNNNDIKETENFRKAYAKALRLLSLRDRSESFIIKALSDTGYDADVCEGVISKLRELGYIDDRRYAGRITQTLLEKGYGRYQIKQKMNLKGIGEDDTETAMAASCSHDDEYRAALQAASKKMRSLASEPDISKKRAKLSRFLVGRGFNYEITKEAVNGILNNDNHDYD